MNGIGLLRCICDETRFEILGLLQRDGELCVGDLARETGKGQPLISHHLKRLKECGIVMSRDEGRRAVYAISGRRLARLVADITRASKEIPGMCSDRGCC